MDQVKIGKFIAQLRKEKNMTQEQLGEKLGVSFKTISKWENGRGLPELSTLKPLSEILNVNVSEILNGEKNENNSKVEMALENTIEYQTKNNKKKETKFIVTIIIVTLLEIIILKADVLLKKESIKYLFLMLLGIVIILLGLFNFKGNIESIHWYNRRKVTKENSKKYARTIGIGTMIIGAGLTISTILQAIYKIEEIAYIVISSVCIGIIFIIYAQFKYNKGLF